MPLPSETPAHDPSAIPQALEEPVAGRPSINDPVQLFTVDYDQNNGDIMSFSPKRRSRTSSSSNNGKRDNAVRSPKQPSTSSPNPKRGRTGTVIAAAASAIVT